MPLLFAGQPLVYFVQQYPFIWPGYCQAHLFTQPGVQGDSLQIEINLRPIELLPNGRSRPNSEIREYLDELAIDIEAALLHLNIGKVWPDMIYNEDEGIIHGASICIQCDNLTPDMQNRILQALGLGPPSAAPEETPEPR